MEPPLLDTSMLLEKPRTGLVTGAGFGELYETSGMADIEWCDIRTGCKGPWWCYPCQTVTKCIGGCFEGAVCIATCGLFSTFMDNSRH